LVILFVNIALYRESTGVDDDKVKIKSENVYKPWAPGGYVAFRLLLAARMCAALWSNISDCDETYNYWEPVRLILITAASTKDVVFSIHVK